MKNVAATEDKLQRLAEVSTAAANVFALASMGNGNVVAALQVADSIQQMRELFDDPHIKVKIEALQDTPLGFRTDRDPKQTNKKTNRPNVPYDWPVVRDAAIEAAMRGLQLVGNQWNIISNRFYATKEGFEYLLRKVPNLTDWRPVIGVPSNKTGGALVECKATWKLDGKPVALEVVIPIKTDDYSGADQIIGKATRKFYKRCYEMMSGISVPDGEAEEAPAALPPATRKIEKIEAGSTKTAPATQTTTAAEIAKEPSAPKNRMETRQQPVEQTGTQTPPEEQPDQETTEAPVEVVDKDQGPQSSPVHQNLKMRMEAAGYIFEDLIEACKVKNEDGTTHEHYVEGCSTIDDMQTAAIEDLLRRPKQLEVRLRAAKRYRTEA